MNHRPSGVQTQHELVWNIWGDLGILFKICNQLDSIRVTHVWKMLHAPRWEGKALAEACTGGATFTRTEMSPTFRSAPDLLQHKRYRRTKGCHTNV